MPRFALKVEYHGGPFSGWQRQNNHPSVQQAVETALAKIAPGPHLIAAAGRTDAGVHATGQVAHCDMARDWAPFRLSEALNFHLKPLPIAILDVAKVPDDWHSRFWATQRQYHFRLLMRRAPATHDAGLVWQVKTRLDLDAMRDAVKSLIGTHDFTTFRSTICQAKSPLKTLDSIEIRAAEGLSGPEVHFEVRAQSFLHNQVRSLIGTLEKVGSGHWTRQDVQSALEVRDRSACGPVCPPYGLYLAGVSYAIDPFASPAAALAGPIWQK
jgi:tRNA pseudouridine38-40 synthase